MSLNRKERMRLGVQRIVEAQKEAKELYGIELDKYQAVDYITKRDYDVNLTGGGESSTFKRASDGKEYQIQDLSPEGVVIKKGKRGPILQGNEDEDYAMGGDEDRFREFILTPLSGGRFSSPGASTPLVRKPDSFQEDYNLLQQSIQKEITDLGKEIEDLKTFASQGGRSGTRAEASQLFAEARQKQEIYDTTLAAAERDGIYLYDDELDSYGRAQFAPKPRDKKPPEIIAGLRETETKSPLDIISEFREPGRKLVSRTTRLSESEVDRAVRAELNKRFGGNDTAGSAIRSMPVGAYKDAEQEIRSAILARNDMNSPGVKEMEQSNYADAMLEARLLMNKAGYAPEIRTVTSRPDYPMITPEALGEYNSVARPEPLSVGDGTIVDFINKSTGKMKGESPAVASGDILRELRRRAISKIKSEDQQNLPKTLSSREDVLQVLKARAAQDAAAGVNYELYGDGGYIGKVPAGKASFAELLSGLGYKGVESDQLGYALGQMFAGQEAGQKARSAKAIGAVPMGEKLGRTDNFGFMNSDKGPLGVRGVAGSADKAIKRESLKNKLKRLDDVKAPGASDQTMAINMEDYPNPDKKITGKEGMIYNNTGEAMPIRIKLAADNRGYGQQNTKYAIQAQLRADAAQKKINEQVRIRNRYVPHYLRQAVGEYGETDRRSARFWPGTAVNGDEITYVY